MWLGLLGPLQVRYDGKTVPVAAAKQRVVLAALLAQANLVVPVEDLAVTVWDGAPPPAARVTLRNYVKRLRQGLGSEIGGRIQTRDPGYLMEVGDDELDLLRFMKLCEVGGTAVRAGRWKQGQEVLGHGLDLWRGPPLADVPSEMLRSREIPRLDQLRLQAWEWHTDAALNLGRHDDLVGRLRTLVDAHPLRERFHAQLMLSLYRCGRQAEALAAYHDARGKLIDDLGVEPGAELQELQQRILAADPLLWAIPSAPGGAEAGPPMLPSHQSGGPAVTRTGAGGQVRPAAGPPRPRQLPASVRHFAGRAAELRELTSLLRHSAGPAGIVVISAIGGCAGVGKTALAVHWAHQVAKRFPDGQLYVNLRGYDPSLAPMEPSEAISGFLSALDVPRARVPVTLEEQAALFRTLLAGRRMLVVLDNARDGAQVRPLLPGSQESMVVVTSRSALIGLIATEGAKPLVVDLLTEAESAELLAGRLGEQRLSAEPDAARELIWLCGRLPLALSVAAARAAASPQAGLASLVTELSTARRPLDVLDGDDPLASVRTVLSWSYDRLSEPAARMFRLLGVHPGPDITEAAAASLADVPQPKARRALDELCQAQSLTEHAPGRFAFHDLLRAFAAEKAGQCDSAGARRTAVRRILDHYLLTAHRAERLLYPMRDSIILGSSRAGRRPERIGGPVQALAWLEAERRVLLAVAGLAAEAGFDAYAEKIPWLLGVFLERQGHWHDWFAGQQIALTAAERAKDEAGVARSHRGISAHLIVTGSYEDAYGHLAIALEIEQRLGNQHAQAAIHLSFGRALDRQGRYSAALGHSRQAVELYQVVGERSGQAAALNAVGWCYTQLGQHREALASCQEAVAFYRELGDRHGEAATWDSLGYAHYRLGQHGEAATCYQRALEFLSNLGDRHHQAVTLVHLGDAQAALGDRGAASHAWDQALGILTEVGHPDAEQVRAKLDRIRVTARHSD